jgi:hypothetical protein
LCEWTVEDMEIVEGVEALCEWTMEAMELS